jgi:hypothetical protein
VGQDNKRKLPAESRRNKLQSQIEPGDPSAAQQLLQFVCNELRKLAGRAKTANEKSGQTL